ncbi:MAG TPA: G/U mismatch-specific DNA glycosylase [Candidatus Saccharimonadales bacterium]|nr:G/U mismatch-specific DNA glycosylase [Candidatus Saccharimonadales bacterium]
MSGVAQVTGAVPGADHAPPTRAQLEAARDGTIDDVIAPGLAVLFCGINPGLYSGATGWHFARPGNRFWKTLYLAGFTDRVLDPSEQRLLLPLGLGLTNVVRRTTATAAELSDEELRAGAKRVRALVGQACPRWLAVVGISAYRAAFDDPRAQMGRQQASIGGTGIWVLPNPSGLNASYQLPQLAQAFEALRWVAIGSGFRTDPGNTKAPEGTADP